MSDARAQRVPDKTVTFSTSFEINDGEREIPSFVLGAFGGFAKNYHHTESNIFCCTECGQFSDGSGNGFGAGLSFELPLTRWGLNLTLGGTFSERGGAFGEVVTGGLPVQDPNSGQYVPLMRRHSYEASLKYIGSDVGLRITPLVRFPFYLRGGLGFQSPLAGSTHYEQTEHIISPVGVFYPENHSSTLKVGEGQVDNLRTSFAAIAAAGYELPIGHDLTLSPEVRYSYPLAEAVETYKWKITSVDAGLHLRWNYFRREEPAPEPPAPAPVAVVTKPIAKPIEPPKPAPTKPEVFFTVADGKPIEIVQTIVTETFPVLPYLFFDSASSVLAPRYRTMHPSEISSFKENILPENRLDAYYDILNIIGARLSRYPGTSLSIRATTDGKEVGAKDAKQLAADRANTIQEYLAGVWGIDRSRLKTEYLTVPQFPSSTEYAEGYQENRRVEFASSDSRVLGPIVYERFREYAANPKNVPLSVRISSEPLVTKMEMTATLAGELLFDSQEKPTLDPIDWTIQKPMAEKIAKILPVDRVDSVEYEFRATTSEGGVGRATARHPVFTRINPFELSRLSLVVFDFDDANLTKENYRKIKDFVKRSIVQSSRLTITGSTDALGEARHNFELSTARAMSVRDLIVAEHPNAQIVSVQGIGASNPKYSLETPEGRYYNRTVSVEVETPLEDVVK